MTKNLEIPVQPSRPHSPAQAWTQRLPSPPRINVPPPLLDSYGLPDLAIPEGSVDFEANGFANAAFLKRVTHGNVVSHNNMIEWKYEQRHQAQQILPFLFLGPVASARDVAFLQRSGITMVLAVRNTLVRINEFLQFCPARLRTLVRHDLCISLRILTVDHSLPTLVY